MTTPVAMNTNRFIVVVGCVYLSKDSVHPQKVFSYKDLTFPLPAIAGVEGQLSTY